MNETGQDINLKSIMINRKEKKGIVRPKSSGFLKSGSTENVTSRKNEPELKLQMMKTSKFETTSDGQQFGKAPRFEQRSNIDRIIDRINSTDISTFRKSFYFEQKNKRTAATQNKFLATRILQKVMQAKFNTIHKNLELIKSKSEGDIAKLNEKWEKMQQMDRFSMARKRLLNDHIKGFLKLNITMLLKKKMFTALNSRKGKSTTQVEHQPQFELSIRKSYNMIRNHLFNKMWEAQGISQAHLKASVTKIASSIKEKIRMSSSMMVKIIIKFQKIIGDKIYSMTSNRSSKIIKACLNYEEYLNSKLTNSQKSIQAIKKEINNEFKKKESDQNQVKIQQLYSSQEKLLANECRKNLATVLKNKITIFDLHFLEKNVDVLSQLKKKFFQGMIWYQMNNNSQVAEQMKVQENIIFSNLIKQTLHLLSRKFLETNQNKFMDKNDEFCTKRIQKINEKHNVVVVSTGKQYQKIIDQKHLKYDKNPDYQLNNSDPNVALRMYQRGNLARYPFLGYLIVELKTDEKQPRMQSFYSHILNLCKEGKINKLCNFLIEIQLFYVAKKIRHDLIMRQLNVDDIQTESMKIKKEINMIFALFEKKEIMINEHIEDTTYRQCFNNNDFLKDEEIKKVFMQRADKQN